MLWLCPQGHGLNSRECVIGGVALGLVSGWRISQRNRYIYRLVICFTGNQMLWPQSWCEDKMNYHIRNHDMIELKCITDRYELEENNTLPCNMFAYFILLQ